MHAFLDGGCGRDTERYHPADVFVATVAALVLLLLAVALRSGGAEGVAAALAIASAPLVALLPRPEDGGFDGGLMAAAGVLSLFTAGRVVLTGGPVPGDLFGGPMGAAVLVMLRAHGMPARRLLAMALVLAIASWIGTAL